MVKVVVSIHGVEIKEAVLSKARSTLGRRPYNDIVIDNLAVSGEHVAFWLLDGEVTMEDLNSTNGTYVNGKVVKKQVLQNSDVMEIGKYKIVLVDEAAKDNAALLERPSSNTATPATAAASAAPAQGTGAALLRILSGAATGRDLPLTKVVTTVGKPGVSVASITRRQSSYLLSQLEGPGTLLLNGEPASQGPTQLANGDLIELADTRMQFALI